MSNNFDTRQESDRMAVGAQPLAAAPRRLFDSTEIRHLLRTPVHPQPLLELQQHSFENRSAVCICKDFREAQRYGCELIRTHLVGETRILILHEMMPLFQQRFVLECVRTSFDFMLECRIILVTSERYYKRMAESAPWVEREFQAVVPASSSEGNTRGGGHQFAETTSVSCICLRKSVTGRWVLMDHESGAVVSPHCEPSSDLVPRLLDHSVQIVGDRLAPYLAMMFDVPAAWKSVPDLAHHSLLIFEKNMCQTGCAQPGIPSRILWSDVLGLVI